MQIKQLSALLDTKVAELDARVIKQQKNLSEANEADTQDKIKQELDELARLRGKLIKSKELAWEAHSLERHSNARLNQRKAMIGLTLCIFGGVSLLILLLIILKNYF